MIHKMKLKNSPFEAIKAGTKTVEMRLYDEKRRKVQIGDIIEFKNITTDEKITVQVVNLYIVKSFEELYKMFDKISLGYMPHEIALYTDMEQYYLKTDIEKYGVLGIGIKLV